MPDVIPSTAAANYLDVEVGNPPCSLDRYIHQATQSEELPTSMTHSISKPPELRPTEKAFRVGDVEIPSLRTPCPPQALEVNAFQVCPPLNPSLEASFPPQYLAATDYNYDYEFA